MNQPLISTDVEKALAAMPPALVEQLKAFGPRVCVAGGFLRAIVAGEKPSDIDVWVDEVATAQALSNALSGLLDPYVSKQSYTIRIAGYPAVQIIYKWVFANPEAAVDSFDFTLARAALWFNGTSFISACAPEFYRDVIERRMTYCAPKRIEAEAGSLFRVFKFYKRGYSISLENLAAVLARATSFAAGVTEEIRAANILLSLQEAGRRIPAPHKPTEPITPDNVGDGASASFGASSD